MIMVGDKLVCRQAPFPRGGREGLQVGHIYIVTGVRPNLFQPEVTMVTFDLGERQRFYHTGYFLRFPE